MDNIPEDKALIVMGYEKVSMQEFLIELQKNQGIVLRTCQQLKMDRHTFYNWYDKDPWFKEVCDKIRKTGRENICDLAEHGLVSLILEKNLGAIIFYLKCNHSAYNQNKDKDAQETANDVINYELIMKSILTAKQEIIETKQFDWENNKNFEEFKYAINKPKDTGGDDKSSS